MSPLGVVELIATHQQVKAWDLRVAMRLSSLTISMLYSRSGIPSKLSTA